MTFLDYFMLVIIGLSFFLGLYRGFFKEFFSLLSWSGSLAGSWYYYEAFAVYLQPFVPLPLLTISSMTLLFFLFLALFTILAKALTVLANALGLSVLKQPLGAAFGILRGGVINFLFLAALLISPVKDESWVTESLVYEHFSDEALSFIHLFQIDKMGEQLSSLSQKDSV